MTRKKKKKKNSTSKNTHRQEVRLVLAKKWMPVYTGKNMVGGYAKHFRVDLLCAVKELRLSSIAVSEQYESSLRQNLTAMELGRKRKQEQKELENLMSGDFDENFEFVAGYTSGGAPYGISKDEIIITDLTTTTTFPF